MHLTVLLHSLGSLGIFPSRAFIPAFVVAVFLRYGHHLPLVGEWGVLENVHDVPTWFTHDITLAVLALLSLVEIWATKNPDVREWLDRAESGVKPGMMLLTTLGVMSVTDAKTVEAIQQASIADGGIALLAAGGVFFLTQLRHSVLSVLYETDEDDSFGIQRVLSWVEDLWVVGAAFFLVILPILVIALSAVVIGILFLLRRVLAAREEAQKISCPSCHQLLFPAARACPHCGAAVPQPCDLGFLGQFKPETPAGENHALVLVEHKRCPQCATRFAHRAARQTCDACGYELFADSAFVQRYVEFIESRRFKVYLLSAAFGLVPVIGAVPAIVYYRLRLVGPYRQYLPAGAGLAARWVARVLCFAILLFQAVPLLGALAPPAMAWISHEVHRRAFCNMVDCASGKKEEEEATAGKPAPSA